MYKNWGNITETRKNKNDLSVEQENWAFQDFQKQVNTSNQ